MSLIKMYCWVDLETPGLDFNKDPIIEVGFGLSDGGFKPVVREEAHLDEPLFEGSVVKPTPYILTRLEAAATAVQQMHEGSGLLEALQRADAGTGFGATIGDIEDGILRKLTRAEQYLRDEGRVSTGDKVLWKLAGSNVGFDRRMLEVGMPRLIERLTYNNYDVSTLREHYKDVVGIPHPYESDGYTHRAQDDIQDHYREARYYRDLSRHDMEPA